MKAALAALLLCACRVYTNDACVPTVESPHGVTVSNCAWLYDDDAGVCG